MKSSARCIIWKFNFYSLALIHHLSISVASSPCLPNVSIVKVFVNFPHISTSSAFLKRFQFMPRKWHLHISDPFLCICKLYKWGSRSGPRHYSIHNYNLNYWELLLLSCFYLHNFSSLYGISGPGNFPYKCMLCWNTHEVVHSIKSFPSKAHFIIPSVLLQTNR